FQIVLQHKASGDDRELWDRRAKLRLHAAQEEPLHQLLAVTDIVGRSGERIAIGEWCSKSNGGEGILSERGAFWCEGASRGGPVRAGAEDSCQTEGVSRCRPVSRAT